MQGTSGHHPGHRCIAVCARLWWRDVWLQGALYQRFEAAWRGGMPLHVR